MDCRKRVARWHCNVCISRGKKPAKRPWPPTRSHWTSCLACCWPNAGTTFVSRRPKARALPRTGRNWLRSDMTDHGLSQIEKRALRPPCEILFAEELAALKANDAGKKPDGWRLS